MENYLRTIEALIVDNSRLQKDLQDALNGKMPSRIITQEEADRCFSKIADVIGITARGSLSEEIGVLCQEFKNIVAASKPLAQKYALLEKEKKAIDCILNNEELQEQWTAKGTVNNVMKFYGVLQMIKIRLDRLVLNGHNNDIVELRDEIAKFLTKKPTENIAESLQS